MAKVELSQDELRTILQWYNVACGQSLDGPYDEYIALYLMDFADKEKELD